MGNDYCLSRKSKIQDQQFFKSEIAYHLERLKDIPIRQQNVFEYENKSIIDLLKNIDINVQDQINKGQEDRSLENNDSIKVDFAQYTQIGNEIMIQLQQKIMDLDSNKQDWSILIDDIESSHFLKIQIAQTQMDDGNYINTIISQFIVPCYPQKFIDYMGNFNEQKKLDDRIDQFKCISKNVEDKEQIIYLSYKKVSILSARDFIYFKKTKLIDEDQQVWCDASKSIQNDKICPIKNTIIRGTIYISGYIIQPLKNILKFNSYSQRFASLKLKSENYSFVQMCSECDYKLKIPFYFAKRQVKEEMINYINKLQNNLQ
ncbi:unnamed protein product [Paramecium sonneborni]|uniref:START domain-containing protein n=1 Tax=Paramecium sonneborni TaxID=65129 RepID=A0A8S1QJJ6_9CILI|nr:unnamed protein product [Paramecium sonneborni]